MASGSCQKRRLNIVGAGRVGRTLARLWHETGSLTIQSVCNRSVASAKTAVEFIGAGVPSAAISKMSQAELWLISASDAAIEGCARELGKSGLLRDSDVVFHCSGALSSAVLSPATESGASRASVHPVKSFANALLAIESFGGTFCAGEGEPRAIETLEPLFQAIGGDLVLIKAESKLLYHAGTNTVCQNLIAVIELGVAMLESSGIERATALKLVEPLVRGTVDNIFQLGTVKSLTGPVSRGDARVVEQHLETLSAAAPEAVEPYRLLSEVALMLSRKQGYASPNALAQIEKLLHSNAKR